ncbi:MAG: hypothetical protein PHW76_02950 [Alphaproteobacteria bacterium]|nr:hypothetical protein [Alphaproteobacteria bacterium]
MTLINKILLGGGAALALAIMIALFWMSLSNARLKARLAETEARRNACALANDEFAQHIARQNAAVEKLREERSAKERKAAEASAKARTASRMYLDLAERIRTAQAKGSACQNAEALFRTYLEAGK